MMLAPNTIDFSRVNEALRNDRLSYDRSLFLMRVETVHHAQPSLRKIFAQSLLAEQAAREVGLENSEAPVSSLPPEQQADLQRVVTELVNLLQGAGLLF